MGYSYYRLHDATVYENDPNASVTITRTGDISYRERVLVGGHTNSATKGVDFNLLSQWVTFQPNQTTANVSLGLKNDSYIEPDETFTVKAQTHRNYYTERDLYYNNTFSRTPDVRWSDSIATITIKDDEKPLPPSYFSVNDVSTIEGGNLNFTISRTGNTSRSGRVYYYTSSGTGSEHHDIHDVGGSVHFGAGETRKTVSVRTKDDQLIEDNETIHFNVYSGSPGWETKRSRYVGTIIDNDKAPEASLLSISGPSSAKEGGSATYTITRSGDVNTAGSVFVQTNGSQYGTSKRIDFKKGDSQAPFTFKIKDDNTYKENQSFYVKLSSLNGFTHDSSISKASMTTTVIDNDPKPLETTMFGVDDTRVKEGLTGELQVRRYGELKSAGTVFYRLTQPKTGYSKTSSVRFNAGQEIESILVPTQDNNKHGPNPSYKLHLTKAVFNSPTSIPDAYAEMIVIDDDPQTNTGSARFQVIGGNRVGDTKTIKLAAVDPDGNGAFSHTWQQENAGAWNDIGSGGSFVLKDAQESKNLRVVTKYTDGAGFAETVFNNAGNVPAVSLTMAREGLFSGKSITLEFNRELQAGTIGNSKFQVKDGKRLLRVKDALIDANEGTVTLNLNRDVTYYDDLLITYKDLVGNQSDGVVQDVFGNDLGSLNQFRVKNSFAGAEGGPLDPITAVGAEYEDGQLLLELDDQANNHKLNRRRFKVWADGKRMKVTNAAVEDDEFVILDVTPRGGRVITDNSVMKLSYKDIRGDQSKGVIEDMAGYDMASITKMAVDVI